MGPVAARAPLHTHTTLSAHCLAHTASILYGKVRDTVHGRGVGQVRLPVVVCVGGSIAARRGRVGRYDSRGLLLGSSGGGAAVAPAGPVERRERVRQQLSAAWHDVVDRGCGRSRRSAEDGQAGEGALLCELLLLLLCAVLGGKGGGEAEGEEGVLEGCLGGDAL